MPDGPSNLARIAHDLGLATWFGGTLFGQVALNPTVRSIRDPRERGRVVNESWGRFNALNAGAILASVASWRLGGLKPDAELRAPGASRLKNLLLGAAAVFGIASGVLGARLATDAPPDAPAGGTPMESGTEPAPDTPQGAARSQRLIGLSGISSLLLLAAVIALSAIIESSAPKPRGVLSRLLTQGPSTNQRAVQLRAFRGVRSGPAGAGGSQS
jgi:hypothetical protein